MRAGRQGWQTPSARRWPGCGAAHRVDWETARMRRPPLREILGSFGFSWLPPTVTSGRSYQPTLAVPASPIAFTSILGLFDLIIRRRCRPRNSAQLLGSPLVSNLAALHSHPGARGRRSADIPPFGPVISTFPAGRSRRKERHSPSPLRWPHVRGWMIWPGDDRAVISEKRGSDVTRRMRARRPGGLLPTGSCSPIIECRAMELAVTARTG